MTNLQSILAEIEIEIDTKAALAQFQRERVVISGLLARGRVGSVTIHQLKRWRARLRDKIMTELERKRRGGIAGLVPARASRPNTLAFATLSQPSARRP